MREWDKRPTSVYSLYDPRPKLSNDRETLAYAHAMLRTAARVMDHTTVEWAEVATAEHYIGHILAGRAVDLVDAARVEHERFVAEEAERDAAERMGRAIG